MICLGIDPGLDGAMVWIDGLTSEVLHQELFHSLGRPWMESPTQMAAYFTGCDWQRPTRIALEQVQIRSAQKGQLNSAIRWGELLAVLALVYTAARIWTPRSAEWMRVMHKDQPGSDSKSRSVALVSSELPGLDLTPGRRHKPHDGLADAGGLALWAARRRG